CCFSFVFGCLPGRTLGCFFALRMWPPATPPLPAPLSPSLSVPDAPPRHYELTKRVHSRNCVVCRKFNEPLNPAVENKIITDEQRAGSCLDQAREGGVDFAVGACFQCLNR